MRFLLRERDADDRPPAALDPAVCEGMTRFIDNALASRVRPIDGQKGAQE